MPTVLAAGTEGSPPPLSLSNGLHACTFIVYTLILTTEMNPHVMSGAKAGRVGEPAGLLRGRLPYRIGLFELEPSAMWIRQRSFIYTSDTFKRSRTRLMHAWFQGAQAWTGIVSFSIVSFGRI